MAEDETQCACGQWLFRVMISPDGRLTGPPSMPEHVRQQMERAWREEPHRFTLPAPLYPTPEVQFQQWAQRNGVRPMHPHEVTRDASAAFGRASEDASRREFYAAWSAHDAALAVFPAQQQDLQRKAEILELERQAAL